MDRLRVKDEPFKSKFWKGRLGGGNPKILYEPEAMAGWGPFCLSKDHWLRNAARPHDGWYEAREQGEVPNSAKGRADYVFFKVACIDALNGLIKELDSYDDEIRYDAYETLAERIEELCWAYLVIRSLIGDLAWRT